ncbi:MAG TPA: carbohydrate binding family 9 domain-containing protein [Acidobacteriaceae bacterium]|jgi:hypothetical protein|nr:carbohydrate binding family 9 domain-containing protein [Acidobacteriaceae bacterium]
MRNGSIPASLALLFVFLWTASRARACDRTIGRINPSKNTSSIDDTATPRPDPVRLPVVRYTPHIQIPHLTGNPRLTDFLTPHLGSVPAREMLRVGNFIQSYPQYGAPASEPTVAYMGYTHAYFFVAFVCHDKTPHLVRAHMLARDSLGDDDFVQIYLDTFHDQRRSFIFQTNALGIQADALYTEQNGSDYSFDTVWDTWGKRTANGYVVLVRIPFTSLYFAKAAPMEMRTWGIVLQRGISHANESAYWPQIKPNVAGLLTQEMPIDGFIDIAHGRNWQVEPYVLGHNLRQLNDDNPVDPYFQSKHLQAYGGIDGKFILHNSLVLDATVNPDFSQVGINNPAAPNQRFPPYFPEVRPFFIENSSYFMTPVNLYYTDNILQPKYGERLTGKLGPWALGILNVDDLSPGLYLAPGDPNANGRANFYVARVNRDIGSRSDVGVIYADREYKDSFNRAGGFDYRTLFKQRWTLSGQAVTSATQNLASAPLGEQACEVGTLTCSGQVYDQGISYSDLHQSWWASYNDTSAGFVTDTGFFRRPDVREPNTGYSYTFRPKNSFILSHGPSIYTERIWDHTGLPLDFYINPSYGITFQHRTSVSANVDFGQDRLRPVDYSILPQNVEYHSHTSGVNFYTSPTPYIAIGGGAYTGTVINYSPPANVGPNPVNVTSPNLNVEVKPASPLDLQNSYTYTHFTDPTTGDVVYDNHQLISRWNYQVTKAVSFNLIGQYISTLPNPVYTSVTNSKNLFADALFTYLPHPGTAVYFGYVGNFANLDRALCTREDNGTCNPAEPILPTTYSSMINDSKTIYVKMTYLLRF